jgi:uncharacterized protein YccT (UPF0319 family)
MKKAWKEAPIERILQKLDMSTAQNNVYTTQLPSVITFLSANPEYAAIVPVLRNFTSANRSMLETQLQRLNRYQLTELDGILMVSINEPQY